jgi:threonylcarbamoyladenosine tRNA methylthiotransferase MtaB
VNKLSKILNRLLPQATFQTITFGCRVNAAESNQLAQLLINNGLSKHLSNQRKSDLYIVNTCAITQKGEYESTAKIRHLASNNPTSTILVTGCINKNKIPKLPNIFHIDNHQKETLLETLNNSYSPQVTDKYTHHRRFLLKIQSGCTANCSYCLVPSRRSYIKSIAIDKAINTVNKAIRDGYQEVIITGVNLTQYTPGLSNLLEALLAQTKIPLISFGSIPLLCVDDKFIHLLSTFSFRLSNFLHVPLQSGSNRILKLMRRPYTRSQILDTFNKLKNVNTPPSLKGWDRGGFKFGTDIIVGFPSETEDDFKQTFDLCQSIGFTKIHIFRFSPRPETKAWDLNLKFPVKPSNTNSRSLRLRSLSLTSNQ